MKDKKLVPALRFGEFEGEWMERKLGSICSKVGSGKTPRGGDKVYEVEGVPFIRSQNVNNGQLILDETHISEEVHAEMKSSKVLPNDVLLNITGGSIGRSCVVPSNFKEGNVNQHVAIIRLKGNDSKFLQSFLASWRGQKLVYEGQTGSGREGLNFESIKKFKINLPLLSEQKKIATFLTATDQRLQLLQQKKAKLEDYKKGVMQQLFSKELRFKDEGGGDFPDWEVKTLGEVGEIINGLTYSPKQIDKSGILVLRSSNVKKRNIVLEDNVFVKAPVFNPVKESDILICVRNGSKRLIGKSAFISKDIEGLAFGAFMTVYRSSFNNFLFHWFDTDDYKNGVHKNLGATINSINGRDLKKFRIPFPSISEQQKIATFLTSIDQSIEKLSTQINQTMTFKKGLLQKMFV